MPHDFTGQTLVIATHNEGKAREIIALLSPYIESFATAGELGLPEPEETEDTFEGNAKLKALAGAKASGKPTLADDSGFCVAALGGAPGVYSARWAGADKDFGAAMAKVNEALKGYEDRSASFVCVLALAWPDGRVETFEGKIEGQMAWPPRGGKGFGYDPVFVPLGHDRTFAEMEAAEKQSMSHRARAFQKLIEGCFS